MATGVTPFSERVFISSRVQLTSCPLAPQATKVISPGRLSQTVMNRRYSRAHISAVIRPPPPQFSLPMPQ